MSKLATKSRAKPLKHDTSSKIVSVIVPVYNAEKHLERCLSSITRQTYKDIEIIVVDDGSTDGSRAICDGYAKSDDRIKVIHQENKGASAARNLGLSKSKGVYITFTDADDWLELDAIGNMVRIIEREHVDCVRTAMFRNSSEGERDNKHCLKTGKYTKESISDILGVFVSGKEQCYVYLLLFKRSLLLKLKPFNEQVHMMEDTCFYMDLFTKVASIYVSDIKTYHYFESEGSVTRSPERYIRNFKDILVVNSELKETLNKVGLLTDSIRESMDLEHVRLMSEYAYLAYINVPESAGHVANTLRGSEGFRKLAGSIDLAKLTFGHRYTVKYLLSESDSKLLKWFKLRLFIDQSYILVKRFV